MTETMERNGVCEAEPQPLRYNLGGGPVSLCGFKTIDRKEGGEVYPLLCADASLEEIIASHVLEHFSHRDVMEVLKHWVEKLKPGGRVRLAVPDFELIVKDYQAGKYQVQGYIMGGHDDENDHHGCIFDRESLTELMIDCGLERIGPWKSDMPGGSALPNTLNLQGFKPANTCKAVKGVRACISVPRFGPLMHPRCAEKAFFLLGIPSQAGQSCFWHQKLSNLMEIAIANDDCEYVLTMDFDTVFSAEDVLELYRLLQAHKGADAVFPLQSKRGCETALFSVTDGNGKPKPSITLSDLDRNLLPANSGHFGLTLFRANSLRKFPRPWMVPEPDKDGKWDEGGHRDADIDFWRRFKLAGFKCFLAPKVAVGHLEEVVKWPGKDLRPVYQQTADYEKVGIPADVAR